MFGALPNKTKQFFFAIIKLSIVVGASYFIYNKLAHNDNLDFSVFIAFLVKNDVFLVKNIIFVSFLTVFNWFFEILKWQNLVSYIKNISFFKALKQSLASHTASLFTPNKIGEYGAKAVYFTKSKLKRILLLNLVGNLTQMCATVIFGLIGFIFFVLKYDMELSYTKIFRLIILIMIIIGFLFFSSKKTIFKIKGFSLLNIKKFILKIPSKIHYKNAAFSLVRYFVFSFQFYYLLHLFGVNVSYFNAMIVISTMYLMSSIIPTLILFDVVIKGSIALFLFNIVGVNDLTILSIITLMWILNFVLPSIIGSFFVINFDYYRAMKTDTID